MHLVASSRPQYDDIGIGAKNGLAGAETNGKWGFIDATGKFVIPPQFELASWFSEGLAAVRLNGKWGFIDASGRFVIPAQFLVDKHGRNANSETLAFGLGFSGGLAEIEVLQPDRIMGNVETRIYIDNTGKRIWPPN